ncbi:hypothetical protein [Denitromonas sp.]|uniref:hypothetical protein n=1 Tax=Denitromonas sp. TaxID=2734609 RepID=UPI003A86BD43
MAWIFFFISVLAVVWLTLLVRRRRRDHLEAEQARAMAFLMENGGAGAAAGAADTPMDASRAVVAGQAAPPLTTAANPGAPRRPYLDGVPLAAFLRLKAALPGHEIFPRGSLRRASGLDAIDKDMLLDFVICTAALEPVAVVDLARGPKSAVDPVKRDTLLRAGVRYACWRREDLPEAAAITAWIEGA